MSAPRPRGDRLPPHALAAWLEYLREIGVRELRAPAPTLAPSPADPRPAPRHGPTEPPVERSPMPRRRREPSPPPRTVPAAAEPTRADPPRQATLSIADEIDAFASPPPEDPARRLEEVREDLGECTRCRLHEGRTHIVFGVGNARARLMFIGEGPGAEEDARGEPFVGRAGKKLDQMIEAIGLEREQVYIANVVKCRPPNNRDPESDEVETCSPFLERQIEAIRPRVIVTLGAPAARTLLKTRIGITKLRGRWQSYRGIPVMPTYHPAYLLRAYTVENRRKVFEDLKAARARLDG